MEGLAHGGEAGGKLFRPGRVIAHGPGKGFLVPNPLENDAQAPVRELDQVLGFGRGNAQGIGLSGTVEFIPGQPCPIEGIHLQHNFGVVPVVVAFAHKSSSGEDEVFQVDQFRFHSYKDKIFCYI